MFLPAVALIALVACGKDSDGDGLTDKDEADLGTDPNAADSDNDGVSDSDEVHMGADPLNPDSDGDGYTDGDEVANASNPLDENSGIYHGGWPFNADKDSMTDPGWDGHASVGAQLPRFKWVDQFGEEVDIYDYAGHGKPIVIDMSEYRCYWCMEAAKMLDHESSAFDGYGYDHIADMVDNGDVYWVTVIDGDYESGADVDDQMISTWYHVFPNEKVALLQDKDRQMATYMQLRGFPDMMLLEDDMTVTVHGSIYTDVWDELNSRFGAEYAE